MIGNNKKIVINALQYCADGSGIAITIRELFGAFTKCSRWPTQIILPKNSIVFPCAETTIFNEAPCTYEEGLRRILFQSFDLGQKYCKNAVLLTLDSKIPVVLPQSCCLIPIITDLAVFRIPEAYQLSRVLLWKMQYRVLCLRASHFIAISEYTKREMTAILGISPEKISVIPCAAQSNIQKVCDETVLQSFRDKYQLARDYILFVGNFNPRKNLARLIHSFDRMKRERGLPHELVIAGRIGWKFDTDEVLRDIAAKDAVRFIGYVPDEDMASLYSAASLLVFPSLYEGFGIPVIEAQKCGVPVLTSNLGALPEAGGEGALYIDPYDETAMARSMQNLLTDTVLRKELINKGFQNAARYSWDISAKMLSEIIEGINL